MKIKLTKDIFTKLVEAGFKEGEEMDFKIPEKKKKENSSAPSNDSEAPKPGEHPPPPVNP